MGCQGPLCPACGPGVPYFRRLNSELRPAQKISEGDSGDRVGSPYSGRGPLSQEFQSTAHPRSIGGYQEECGSGNCGSHFRNPGGTAAILNGNADRQQTERTLADATILGSGRTWRKLVQLCEKILRALGIEGPLGQTDRVEVGRSDEPAGAPRSASERIYGAATEMRRVDVFAGEDSPSCFHRAIYNAEEANRLRDIFLRSVREATQRHDEQRARELSDRFISKEAARAGESQICGGTPKGDTE